MTDYKALYEAQVEENKRLTGERDVLHNLNIKEGMANMLLRNERDNLKEKNQNLQMNHIDMKCEISGTTLTEDDLQMSLEIGRLICESAYDDLPAEDKKTREELKKEVKEIKKKSMKSISKLGREKKDLKKEHDRMSAYMYSREIKYCDKCRKYGDYHEGYGDFVYNDDTCEYICHECNEEEGHYAVCETCDKKLFSDEDDSQYSSITSCTYCDDCYEKLDSDQKD